MMRSGGFWLRAAALTTLPGVPLRQFSPPPFKLSRLWTRFIATEFPEKPSNKALITPLLMGTGAFVVFLA